MIVMLDGTMQRCANFNNNIFVQILQTNISYIIQMLISFVCVFDVVSYYALSSDERNKFKCRC